MLSHADSDGSRMPSKLELDIVKEQARWFVSKASQLAGKPLLHT